MKKSMKLALLAFLAYGSVAYAQPKLEVVGGDTYNWGTVKPGDSPLKGTIVIKNSGTEKLNITEVKPGCGCTTAPISKTDLAPGDTASISVTLNISGNANDVTKSIKVASNDPAAATKYLYLKAKIFYPIVITPTQYFTFNDMNVGVKKDAKLKIKNNTDKSVTLSDFVTPANIQLNLMGKKILAPNEEFEVTATANPDKVGYFNGTVKFKTNDPDMKEVSLQCFGNVKESIMNN